MDFEYKSFLSYSHAADTNLAVALQRALQRIGKPWYRRSACKIFRDETSMAASPALWSGIERELAKCEFFILMASVRSATSPWVRKEVQWWLSHREIDSFIVVVTEGDIAWETTTSDFDWRRTTCLPMELRGQYKDEPLYVDMRWARKTDALTLSHTQFRSDALSLAAALHGRPKDEIDSEEIRQYRRFRITAWSIGILLNVMLLVAIYASVRVRIESNRATENWRQAQSRELTTRAMSLFKDEHVQDALKVGIMAWKLADTDEANTALGSLAEASSEMARVLGQHASSVAALDFSPDSSVLATISRDGSIQTWKAGDWTPLGRLMTGAIRAPQGIRFNASGSHLIAWNKDRDIELWDVRTRAKDSGNFRKDL